MSVNLSIKDVPDDVAQRLRERASRNHRSMQRELLAIVESAVNEPVGADGASRGVAGANLASQPVPGANLASQPVPGANRTAMFLQTGEPTGKPIEQIAAELRAKWPVRGGLLSVDIIRADRDSR